MASPVIADPFHRMKYMERHGSGLRKIVRETEKPPGYTAAYNPKIFSTATDFRVILKNVNYQLSQKNLVNDQVSEQDKSPDIPHTVLNLCIHLIAHGSEGAQITHAHSIMGTANDKSYDATHVRGFLLLMNHIARSTSDWGIRMAAPNELACHSFQSSCVLRMREPFPRTSGLLWQAIFRSSASS